VRLGVRSQLDNPDIGIIHLYPIGNVKGSTVSVTTAKAPKKAMDAFQKAQKELSRENVEYSKLVENLQKAVEIYPGFAEAWQFLGETYIMEGKESEAMDAFRRAIEADHQYLPPYATLGELELRANHIEEAAQLTGRAIELNPYAIGSQYCHAIAQYYLGDLGKAEESLRKVLESSEAGLYPASHRLLGAIYSERKDYGSAAEEFNRFLETNPPENDAEEVRKILDEWTRSGLI
jgi:tetratricopeptide (TPR) repeat protein